MEKGIKGSFLHPLMADCGCGNEPFSRCPLLRNDWDPSVCTCSSEISPPLPAQHRRLRGGRGEAHGGLQLSVFKGVSTPHFCIIHLTPRRWSISRLQPERLAISWRATPSADAHRRAICTQIHNFLHFRCQMRGSAGPCGADLCAAAFKTTYAGLDSGLRRWTASGESAKDKVRQRRKKIEIKREMNIERETDRKGIKGKPPHPLFSRHWFIIVISLISTAVPIFQMSFSNLCQSVWPFFLIQLMTTSVARRICNSDWVFYRHSGRHTGVFVCLSLSVSAQYLGRDRLGALHTRENMCPQGTKP